MQKQEMMKKEMKGMTKEMMKQEMAKKKGEMKKDDLMAAYDAMMNKEIL